MTPVFLHTKIARRSVPHDAPCAYAQRNSPYHTHSIIRYLKKSNDRHKSVHFPPFGDNIYVDATGTTFLHVFA